LDARRRFRGRLACTPQALYTKPANLFVAGFIGSPSMNLVPGPLAGVGGPGQIVGFRPEHLELGNGKPDVLQLEALVEVVEYLGDEQLAHLRLGDAPILAKLPVEEQLEEGSPQQFSVPRSKVLLFDAATENALGTA
jgi:multiple sugar transport system ATP-binding protein